MGGFTGDLARSALILEGGRRGNTARAGALLLRFDERWFCFALTSLLGLKSASSSMRRPISKSSSGSGLATLTRCSVICTCFFNSSIFFRCFALWPDSNKSEGMTSPSSSLSPPSHSLSSVSCNEREDTELDDEPASAKPRVE